MKITKIHFKNINSFYGEHPPIDFTQSPLSQTGLFMISGPTGAGKSTLLDVISLALFNQIPRFSAKSQTVKQINENGSIVNATACEEPKTEAYAEVEYEVKGKQYRSRWSIAKNRNGNWSDNQMEVALLPQGEILTSKKSDVPPKNEELIGLNYNQFIQSIVLAQGNFAEFLRADAKSRSKLLEDITGTYIYRQMGAAAFQKNKQAQTEIDDAEKLISSITLLSDEARNEKEEIQNKETQNVKELTEKLAYFREQLAQKTAFENAEIGLQNNTASFETWKTKRANLLPKLEKLEKHLFISDLATPLSNYENLQKNLAKEQLNLADVKGYLKKNDEEKTRRLTNANALFKTTFSENDFEQMLNEKREAVTELETQLEALKNEGQATLKTIKQEIEGSKNAFIAKLNPQSYEANLTALENYLEELSNQNLGVGEADIEALENLNVRYQSLGNWINKAEELQRIIELGREEKKALGVYTQRKNDLEKELESFTEKINKATEKITSLEKNKEEERKKVNLEKLRNELQEGEACPLCGSTEHPYRQHITQVLGKIETELLAETEAKKVLEKTEKEKSGDLQKTMATLENTQKNYNKLTDDYRLFASACKEFAETLKLPEDSTIDFLQNEQQSIENKRKQINEFVKNKSAIDSVKLLRKLTEENQIRINAHRKLSEDKADIFTGKNSQAETSDLLTKWAKTQANHEQFIKQMDVLEKAIQEKEKQLVVDTQALHNLLKDKGLASIEEAKDKLLPSEEVNQIKEAAAAVQKEETTLTTQRETLETQKQNALEKITTSEGIDELKIKIESVSSTQNELLKTIGQLQKELEIDTQNRGKQAAQLEVVKGLKSKAIKWAMLNDYIGDSNGDKFSGFAQSLTLNNLIGLANQRLQNLSDRYVLSKLTNDPTASLRIIDLYQGNAERSVDTLSGGETFTISLAMALALSDLASQNVRLDSLFIDEGFGTLDNETLEAAVATLERLQYDSQKTVGIISHRQELIERISTQIRVQKNNDGKSFVSVVG